MSGQTEDGKYIMYKGQMVKKRFDSIITDPSVCKMVFFCEGAKAHNIQFYASLGVNKSALRQVDGTKYTYIGNVTKVDVINIRTSDRATGCPTFKLWLDTTLKAQKIPSSLHTALIDTSPYKLKMTALITYGLEPKTLKKLDEGLVECTKAT